MKPEELFAMADFAAGEKCETVIVAPEFRNVLVDLVEKGLFDTAIRSAWGHTKFWHIYGDANAWNVFYAAWALEERVASAGNPALDIRFKVLNGANHFVSPAHHSNE